MPPAIDKVEFAVDSASGLLMEDYSGIALIATCGDSSSKYLLTEKEVNQFIALVQDRPATLAWDDEDCDACQ